MGRGESLADRARLRAGFQGLVVMAGPGEHLADIVLGAGPLDLEPVVAGLLGQEGVEETKAAR